jgi:glycosyltransferase involved in cell wall biosynthesis
MKIIFLISSLGSGGAERVASILCNEWARNNQQVEIVTFEPPQAVSYYELHPAIQVHRLDLTKENMSLSERLSSGLNKVQRLYNTIKTANPDLVISYMTEMNILSVVAARLAGKKIIISERVHPAFHPIGKTKEILRRVVYPFSTLLVVQTQAIKIWCQTNLRMTNLDVIPNPVDLAAIDAVPPIKRERKYIMAVGRLNPQKGFDYLIRVFAEIAGEYSNWDLIIWGEGGERGNLEKLIAQNNLQDRILLPGMEDNIYGYMKGCDLFAHPARYEGFPNVVLEALASNCAVIATDESGGGNELLCGTKHGYFTTHDKLKDGLRDLMSNPSLRKIYQQNARAAIEQYDTENICQRWMNPLH